MASCDSSLPARSWDDPVPRAAFPWFNTLRYWQDRILELKEQIALMDEPPLPCLKIAKARTRLLI